MMINTNAIVSASEANQNFSRVARIADAQGQAVIFKNNRPKYLLVDIEATPYRDLSAARADLHGAAARSGHAE